MFKRNRMIVLLLIVLVVGLVAACQPQTQEVVKEVPVEVTRIITETVTEEGQSVEVTRVVTEEVVVTATPAPEQQVSLVAPHPDTYTWLTYGDIDTMDPNLAYDTASANLIQNVMEGLIYYNHTDPTSFVPQLATEVPSIENGGISEDGMTYTFNIRQGVKFHNGDEMKASDVKASLERYRKVGATGNLLEPVTDIEVTGDYEVTFTMAKATPTFLEAFSSPRAPAVIIPEEDAEAEAGKTSLIGT
ncbi:MAG: hypothetical protein KC441_03510, partial [Anaerolineales bacterium]|nr:hypothetical protein [Anaerolineales bacterium]